MSLHPPSAPAGCIRFVELLPRLSRTEVEVGNAMLATLAPLAGRPHADAPLTSLANWLSERTGKPTSLRFFRAVAHHDASELPRRRTDAWGSWLEFPAERARGVLFVDAAILEYWLEGLAGKPVPFQRRLFPTTVRDYAFGLYLVTLALEHLTGAGLPPLILPSEEPDPRRIVDTLTTQRFPLYELVFIAEGHDRRGLVRLFVPAALASAAVDFARHAFEAHGLLPALTGQGLAERTVDVPVILGQTELSPDAFRRLEPGDVVLLDRNGLAHDEFGTPGGARLYLGPDVEVACTVSVQSTPPSADTDGTSGTSGTSAPDTDDVGPDDASGGDDEPDADADSGDENDSNSPNGQANDGDANDANDKAAGAGAGQDDDTEPFWQLTLESISAHQPLAPGSPMTHEHADDERTSLLGHATMTLEARIGAVTMNLGQLARLKPGQIIGLDHPVNRPIDLFVNGQHVGTGELVDVEGVLGVRVLRVGRR